MRHKFYPAILILMIVCLSYLVSTYFVFFDEYALIGFAIASLLVSHLSRTLFMKKLLIGISLFVIAILYFKLYKGFSTTYEILRFRVWFVDKAQYFHEPRHYALLKSLVIGDRRLLDVALKSSFRSTGCFHLIAISGLHFGILALILHTVFRKVAYKIRFTVIGVILAIYLCIAGFPPSAVRAFFMLSIYYCARICFIRVYILNIWAVTATVMLLVNPAYFNQLGFWLSIVSTLGIITVLPILKTTRNLIVQSFIVSVAAQFALLPIILYYFGYVNYLSVFLNVAASLLVIPLAWIGFLFFFPLPVLLIKCFVFIDETITSILFFIIEGFEQEKLLISSSPWPLHWIILYYSVWLAIQWLIYRKYVIKKSTV